MNRGMLLVGLALSALFIPPGCGEAKKADGNEAGRDEVRIGVIHPLSGKLETYGRASLNGIRMRVEEVNAAGGIEGRKLVLCVEDNRNDKTASINAFNKLAGSDEVSAVIAPLTSTNALAIRARAKELRIPAVSPTATNDLVTLRNEFMFRACFNDTFQGQALARYALRELRLTQAAILKDQSSDYSLGLSASYRQAFEAGGGKIAAEEGYRQGDTDFKSQLLKVKESGAQLLFVPGYPPEVPLIIKQCETMGVTARLCGADGWDDEDLLGGAGARIEGSVFVGAFHAEDQRQEVRRFVAEYQKRYGTSPGTFAALGYDTVSMLAEALKKGRTSAAVREGLAAIKDLEAVTGKITMAGGDARKPAIILEAAKEGGKFVKRFKTAIPPE